jgi:signal transduction histidine kinase
MFRSLRLRLAFSHAFVLAVMLVALGSFVQFLLARNLDNGVTAQLQQEAQAQVQRMVENDAALPPADVDAPSAAAVQVAVYGAPSGAPLGEPSEIPPWLGRRATGVSDLEVAGEHVRVVTVPAVVGGRTVAWVEAGRSLVPEERLLHWVRLLFLLGGALVVVASLAGGWWLAGSAVRPVEQAYEAQAGFAADASHELRTPLAFVRTGVEVLAEHDPALGEEVLSQVDYLTGLSQRLLHLARAEGGRLVLEKGPVDLAEPCRSSAHRSENVHGNHVALAGNGGVVVHADSVAIEAALDAVLENAARHGGGDAEMRWQLDGDRAVIAVTDHGPGILASHAHRAFDRFFRVDPSRARDTGGAGLGLALARALVEAQGGRMWLEPTPGGGVTAKIAFRV